MFIFSGITEGLLVTKLSSTLPGSATRPQGTVSGIESHIIIPYSYHKQAVRTCRHRVMWASQQLRMISAAIIQFLRTTIYCVQAVMIQTVSQ